MYPGVSPFYGGLSVRLKTNIMYPRVSPFFGGLSVRLKTNIMYPRVSPFFGGLSVRLRNIHNVSESLSVFWRTLGLA